MDPLQGCLHLEVKGGLCVDLSHLMALHLQALQVKSFVFKSSPLNNLKIWILIGRFGQVSVCRREGEFGEVWTVEKPHQVART